MPAVNSLQGSLTSAGSNSTADLLGQVAIDGATLNSTAAIADLTEDGLAFKASAVGLYSWTVNAPFKFPSTPQHGLNPTGAYITQAGSGLYLTNVYGFDLTIAAPFAASTDDTQSEAETYILADVTSCTGTYTARVDDTVALKVPRVGDTATFKIGDEATEDDVVAAAILITSMNVVRQRGSVTEIQYGFESNGAIQIKGDSPLFPVALPGTLENIPAPAFDEIVFQTSTGRTLTGDAAWSSIQIGRTYDAPIGGSMTLQGSGLLIPV